MSGEKKDSLQELRSEDFEAGVGHGAVAHVAHPIASRVGPLPGSSPGEGGAQGLMGCRLITTLVLCASSSFSNHLSCPHLEHLHSASHLLGTFHTPRGPGARSHVA